jgi:Cu2+-exporting ATPase
MIKPLKPCLHCGLDTKKAGIDFCCLGCAAAYKIVSNLGFVNYYKLRQINNEAGKIKPEITREIDISEFVFHEEDQTNSVWLMVLGLHCAACIWLIESILKKQKNVINARINLAKKTLFLKWRGDPKVGNELINLICTIGYKLLPFDEKILNNSEKKYNDFILRALAVAGFGAGNIMLFSLSLWFCDVMAMGKNTRNLLHFFSALIALPVIIYSARPFFISAAKSVKSGFPNMDLVISIAIFLTCITSILQTFRGEAHIYFDSAVMLIFFLLIGRYLDLKARKKAFAVAAEFMMLAASFGRVEENCKIKILPAQKLQKDMILVVAAGEKIAADGIIIEGESEIDTSLITGEFQPQKVFLNQEVYAGTINMAAPLKIKITKIAQNSLLCEIMRLSQEVQNKKNHYIRIADHLAKFYAPAVHLLAFFTFALWFKSGLEIALVNATAVLIISCPCALALAVPIVQTIAVTNLTKKGIVVKSGEALEKLREINIIVFDKTGSLTLGLPKLSGIFLLRQNQKVPLSKQQKKTYLKLAASLAKKSQHPLSQAILASCKENLEELQVQENHGFGLEAKRQNKILKLGKKSFCGIENYFEAQENFLSCFARFGDEELVFLFADALKEDARATIKKLQKNGKKLILLSGDSKKNVQKIAQKLQITEFYFEQTPVAKVQFLEKLKSENKKFVMVGDGLNDVAALGLSDVAISFSRACDISQNVADIIIQGQKLMPVAEIINCAKKSLLLMKQNLLIALIYNSIAIPYAILGHVVPLSAAIAMSSSSLLVLLNSLRMNQTQNY